jgi:hypothetical protein
LNHVHVATSLRCNSSEFLLQLLIYFAQQRNVSNEFHLFLYSIKGPMEDSRRRLG